MRGEGVRGEGEGRSREEEGKVDMWGGEDGNGRKREGGGWAVVPFLVSPKKQGEDSLVSFTVKVVDFHCLDLVAPIRLPNETTCKHEICLLSKGCQL